MLYLFFGPLERSHEDLWRVSVGELGDLIEGWRYNQYLQSRRDARLARWIVSAWCKRVPSVEDMTGVWDDGLILGKAERYQRIKRKILKKKQPL